GITVNQHRADDLAPRFALRDVERTAAVVASHPVVAQRRRGPGVYVEVAGQLHLCRTAAEVLDGRVDDPQADVLLRAGPTVGRRLELDGGIVVLVLRLSFVGARGQAAN